MLYQIDYLKSTTTSLPVASDCGRSAGYLIVASIVLLDIGGPEFRMSDHHNDHTTHNRSKVSFSQHVVEYDLVGRSYSRDGASSLDDEADDIVGRPNKPVDLDDYNDDNDDDDTTHASQPTRDDDDDSEGRNRDEERATLWASIGTGVLSLATLGSKLFGGGGSSDAIDEGDAAGMIHGIPMGGGESGAGGTGGAGGAAGVPVPMPIPST